MASRGTDWPEIAGDFPPTLVTNQSDTGLKKDQTPVATGLDVTAEGFLKSGTIPTGTTRVSKTYTISAVVYKLYYERLWRASGSGLLYYAPHYTTVALAQDQGEIEFSDDAEGIVTFLPIGEQGLVLFKPTGAYIISNANSMGGNFQRSDFIQEAKLATETHAVELDGTVYFCSGTNVYSLKSNGNMEEISFPVRGGVTAAAIKADYQNKYLIIGATHAYDVNTKRWFNYSGSTFTYTTPALRQKDYAPFAVDRIGLVFDSTATGLAEIKFQTKEEERDWSEVYTISIESGERGQDEWVQHDVTPGNARDFQVRITALNANIKIKSIMAHSANFSVDNWGE